MSLRQPKHVIINGKTLEQILIDHKHWLYEECFGWENMKADLHGADLHDVDLTGVNLSMADLSSANLSYAKLRGAILRGAILNMADLYCANLTRAKLSGADLTSANMIGVDLYCADLTAANLFDTDLHGANGDLIAYRKGKILTEDIIGYKKCRNNVIVTLKIPRGAIVFSINGRKCRTNKAEVIAIEGSDRAYSKHKYMSYYVGDKFNVYDFNCMYNVECGEGIHFFMSILEAEHYY